MTVAAFRTCFGVGPAEVGRIDFKGRGMTLEMAQLTAVAAVALLYEAADQPPPPSPPHSDVTSSTQQADGTRPDNTTTRRTEPALRRVVLRPRPPALTITFGSGRVDEPIVIDDGAGSPAGLPIVIDSDDEADGGDCGPTWLGSHCWSVHDGDDVEPGCDSGYCREGRPNPPSAAVAADSTGRRAEPSPLHTPAEHDHVEEATSTGPPNTPASPCYCPSGDVCRCRDLAAGVPLLNF